MGPKKFEIFGCTDLQIDGWMDGWMDEWMDERVKVAEIKDTGR
jgi:hypothetical protein